jgi:hypothetical protein
MTSFIGFPKIPRWNRNIIITEKIDGTNAGIYFSNDMSSIVLNSGREVPFLCASRTRWIFPENDNHGFAKWAYSQDLNEWKKLGPGMHHGEWWGDGIQRRYGLKERRFSLFNTNRWTEETKPIHCHVVPVLYIGRMYDFTKISGYDEDMIIHIRILKNLEKHGSIAAPGFMRPEGIVIYHTASNNYFKITLENDDIQKGKV